MIGVRLQPDQLVRLDAWIATLPDPKPTRPEAIRRALEAMVHLGGLGPAPLHHATVRTLERTGGAGRAARKAQR